MTKYMEYTKGGDILIAPSLSYKHRYILKCDLCDEFFGEFELFFPHYLSHYEMESSEDGDNLSQSDALDEDQFDEEQTIYENDNSDGMKEEGNKMSVSRKEYMSDMESIASAKADFDGANEYVVIKKETSFKESEIIYSHADIEHVILESTGIDSKIHDNQLDNIEPITKKAKTTIVEDKLTIEFVRQFMKSKDSVTKLIAAYKNEPNLWNFDLPVQNRKIEKRLITWNKIAGDLKKNVNFEISGNQVSACILYLRQRYRETKRCGAIVTKNGNEILPTWVYKRLQFLNQFVESNPIGHLDIHQDLSRKQTIQVLSIFQRCSHLWDTSAFEYYGTSQRSEALSGMRNVIAEEMDLEVDEDVLKTYISDIRSYVSLEKRQRGKEVTGAQEKVKYKNHLLFLFDHVGPFECSYCGHIKENPLTLKAHESKHDGTMPFKCPKCFKECKYVDSFINHMKRHMGDLNHKCKVCGKKFIRALELREHMRCHTGDKPFCCDICGSSFRQRTGFSMHMRRHTKKYISFCPFCSKGFYTKDSMEIHAKKHKDERDFVCPICGKAFKTRRTLKSHVATHENGNYECTLCGKSFKNSINLWQHKRKHRLKSAAQQPLDLNSPFIANIKTDKNKFY